MSVIIIGGNERMERLYHETCLAYGYKRAKVFTKTGWEIRKQLGAADLYILFTNTVSHKMAITALGEAKRHNARVERCHSSSLCALRAILKFIVQKDAKGTVPTEFERLLIEQCAPTLAGIKIGNLFHCTLEGERIGGNGLIVNEAPDNDGLARCKALA